VANAVTALTDIHEASIANYEASLHAPASSSDSPPPTPTSATTPQGVFIIDSHVLNKLLVALNECSEWGRIAILNALAKYKAQGEEESEHICERVMPQFQHANGSVLLSAVRVSGSLVCSESSSVKRRQR
jgi:AP-1 complex subunit beta-1